ncbi:prevent-host-death family protein [Rhodoblastus acidophilus]|uniref:Antitoxin n=1 Tax=Rhodoblastus acidophilus TaxID=1074 RepID=A0A212S9T0_RHOAC|nr:type II toxin-antitoxin system Phd/YefM family antitoxin [Rhodoblastus acidophilus]MCW2319214.1 prevent-host-death family protein [Rhodoblastus acidophilus]SNB82184.1 prevent-host-death family protein [Rhodoblastus acidophilus]
MDVLKVSAAEFQRNIGRYQDLALRQPVAVTRNGRESCVLLSTEEYRRLQRRAREVLSIDDFTEAEVEAVRGAVAPDDAANFDSELQR